MRKIMAYCMQCGQSAVKKIPNGDTKMRLVCEHCGFIHYENPKMVCGVLAVHSDKILLCRRAIEPRYGFWTLPAGFMEIGETMKDGAIRETLEEANAIAINAKLYCLFDIPEIGQIHAMYLANLADGRFGVGAESLESRLMDFDEISNIGLENIAFKTVSQTICLYQNDKENLIRQGKNADDFNLYPLHEICILDYK